MTRCGTWALAIALIVLPGLAAATDPFESNDIRAPMTKVDALVFGRLQKLGIAPANPCSDPVFVRRVYFDAIGTLPTADEVRAFLAKPIFYSLKN